MACLRVVSGRSSPALALAAVAASAQPTEGTMRDAPPQWRRGGRDGGGTPRARGPSRQPRMSWVASRHAWS